MTLHELLLEQNYLHSLILNGINVEENKNKYDKNASSLTLLQARMKISPAVLEPFICNNSTEYSFKLGSQMIVASTSELYEDGAPRNDYSMIGNISRVVGNIVGEAYISEGTLYLVYRRNTLDMNRSLAVCHLPCEIINVEVKF